MLKSSLEEHLRKRRESILSTDIVWLDKTGSTQDYVKEKAVKNRHILAVAGEQDAGYGRYKRKWHSPRGGLWFSVSLRMKISPVRMAELTPVTAVSLSETLDSYIRTNLKSSGLTGIKKPNDILLGNKKIAGCLVETAIRNNEVKWIVLGVGINVNNRIPGEIGGIAVSLKEIFSRKIDKISLLSEILDNLENNYTLYLREGYEPFRDTYNKKLIKN